MSGQAENPLQGLEIGKKLPPKLIFNNPRSSIKPESAADPNNFYSMSFNDIYRQAILDLSKLGLINFVF